MEIRNYVIGVDYGTDSVRSVLVDASNGKEISVSIFYYPRWKNGMYCDPSINQFRQHPLDYLEGLENTIKNCVIKAGPDISSNVKGISIDTTGSTPIAVNKDGIALSLLDGFKDNPNAMFILWKDHTAIKEAAEINEHAEKFNENYLKYVGGIYSSEWYWSKLLHIVRADKNIADNLYSFVEHCDWIPYVLTGLNDITQMKRSVCSAGHKALWNANFNGFPPKEFFNSLDPLLKKVTQNLFVETFTSDKSAGTISSEWAKKLGLPKDVVIGIGAFDAHMGAVGGQIEPYYISKVMGTSTCDMLVAPEDKIGDTLIKGICGQVSGSIIPNMVGLEAGQSAFGDAYAWFKNILLWPFQYVFKMEDENAKQKFQNMSDNLISRLSTEAEKIAVNEKLELAIDWMNGRRTPDANQEIKGAFASLNLATDAPRMFRALAEATCFGAKAIVESFIFQGIPVKGIIGLGGVAKKSSFIMQMMADVLNMPIKIHKSEQTCAAGAAMFAATASGIYATVEDAMKAMGQGFNSIYYPNNKNVKIYQKRYEKYKKLGAFIEKEKI